MEKNMENNINKFADKAEYYDKYRINYSNKILDYFNEYNFCENSIIADIGSGTGKLAKIFLDKGNIVYAVEPNDNMRNIALSTLNEYKNFVSINGSAEITTLQNNIIDFVVVGQAFHWFDDKKALEEFKRILKNNGVLALIWYNRKTNSTFMQEYEDFLGKNFPKYNEKNHRDISGSISDEKIKGYFSKDYKKITLENNRELNFNELFGGFSSASYSPKEGTKEYYKSKNILEILFNEHNINNKVIFEYETIVYIGRI
jgi:ubiquinone/menaquinone biosynthesis C-methylase UbiE